MSTVTVLKNNSVDSIAIGGFDGMHTAHQKLFSCLGENGAIVVIETGYANLTPKKDRERFSHSPLYYLELEDIRHLSGEAFVVLLQDMFPKLQKIVVGYDFHFGNNRKHSVENLCSMFKGSVEVIDEVMLEAESVHSHKIRAFLKEGKIEKANRFLAHNYTISGKLISGQGIGKKELVATINLICKGYLLPKDGVYATLTQIDDEEHFHPSVSFIGHRKSTDNSFAIETHILNEELTCKRSAHICFLTFLRENRTFKSLELLKKQIQIDCIDASNVHSIKSL